MQKFATTSEALGDIEYTFQVKDVRANVAGQPINATVTQEGSQTVVTLPTQGVTAPVVLSYTVSGAATREPTGQTTVAWTLLQGLSLPVQKFTATIVVPTTIESVQ